MKKYLIFFGIFYCSLSQANNTDVLIKKHPLIGTTVVTPDFTLVVGGMNDSYSQSPVIKKMDANLITLDDRSSVIGFPTEGLYTKKVLLPNSKLTVKEVYRSKPSLVRSIFAGDIFFAIVSDNSGEKYTVPVFENEIFSELNDCKTRLCKSWQLPLKSILESTNKELQFLVTYYLLDDKGSAVSKNILPPYPTGILNRSREKLVAFLQNKKIPIVEIDKHHPFVSIKANSIQFCDLFLHFETLKIKSVSTLEVLPP